MQLEENNAFSGIEEKIGKSLNIQYSGKSQIDKALAKEEEKEILEIIKKEFINKTDQSKLMNLLVSSEIKLSNFGDYDRYLIGKYLVWIQDFALVQDHLFNYIENVEKKKLIISPEAKEILIKTIHKNSEVLKSMVNLYLYLTRSSLSLGATGFDVITSQRFEYIYPNQEKKEEKTPLQIFRK